MTLLTFYEHNYRVTAVQTRRFDIKNTFNCVENGCAVMTSLKCMTNVCMAGIISVKGLKLYSVHRPGPRGPRQSTVCLTGWLGQDRDRGRPLQSFPF